MDKRRLCWTLLSGRRSEKDSRLDWKKFRKSTKISEHYDRLRFVGGVYTLERRTKEADVH